MAAGLGPGSRPARADCLYVVIDVTTQDGAPEHVVGYPDPCVIPTPWNHTDISTGGVTRDGLPPGTPNGFTWDIRIPEP